MNKTTAAAAVTVLALTLAGCGSEPDVAACKNAMHKQYSEAKATGAEGTRPAACEGVDDKTLERLVGEVLQEQLNADQLEQDLKDLEQEIDGTLDNPETEAP